MATKKKEVDALDALEAAMNENPKLALTFVLWKLRHGNPEMSMQVTREDIKGLEDCARYLEVEPDVRIFRREAVPPHDAVPATRPGGVSINAFKGAPAAEFVTICVVAKGTEDTFKVVENNEEDAQRGEKAAEVRRLRETLPGLATAVNNSAAAGEFSRELVMEVCHGAVALARA